MSKITAAAKRAYAKIPQMYKDDISEVCHETIRFAKISLITKAIFRLTEMKK